MEEEEGPAPLQMKENQPNTWRIPNDEWSERHQEVMQTIAQAGQVAVNFCAFPSLVEVATKNVEDLTDQEEATLFPTAPEPDPEEPAEEGPEAEPRPEEPEPVSWDELLSDLATDVITIIQGGDYTAEELAEMRTAEEGGRNRKTVLDTIDHKITSLES